jgi:hypothetical protein
LGDGSLAHDPYNDGDGAEPYGRLGVVTMIPTLLAGLIGAIIVVRSRPKIVVAPARVRRRDPRDRRRR